jgi:ABC-2 type transport system permease protein
VTARTVLLVARRELVERVRTRTYVLSTGALVAGVAVAVTVPHALRSSAGSHAASVNIAYGAAILLYVALVLAGTWVTSGIVEEKSSRVVEVMLATVRPGELLAGKLVGIGLVALGQVAAAAGSAVATALAVGSIALPHTLSLTALEVIGWFALGYALYATAFAAAASLVSRQEDAPAVTTPLNAVMIAAFLTSMTAAEHPAGELTRVLSLTPPFAPLLMPVRQAAGPVPAWEVALAVALALGAIAVAVRAAATIYGRTALHAGARIPLRAGLLRR